MNEADDQSITAVYQIARKDAEHTRRTGSVIRLGRTIMEHLEPRHRHLFLEYERQTSLLREMYLKHALDVGRESAVHTRRRKRCCELVVPNKMPNTRV